MKITLTAILLCLASPAAAQPVLKQEPAIGSVPEGKRLLIDDGSCPAGKIKEIIGGNIQKKIRRQVRCIDRR